MPLRLPALCCSKPSSACLPNPCGERFSGDPRKLSGDALVYVPLPGFLTRLCAQTVSRLSLAQRVSRLQYEKKRQDFLPLLVCGKALDIDINPLRGV